MILGYPFCAGAPGRPHPEQTMRLEKQAHGGALWRCPECWATAQVVEEEPLDWRLDYRDEVVVFVARAAALRGRDWSDPVRFRFEHTADPRVLDLVVREVA